MQPIQLPDINVHFPVEVPLNDKTKIRFTGRVSQIDVDFFHPLTMESASVVIRSAAGYRVVVDRPDPWWKRLLDVIAPPIEYDGPTGLERPEPSTSW